MTSPIYKRDICGKAHGFTLVETLVSAAILTIVIVALVAMVRKGRDMEITDKHRRQARLVINSLMESPQYNYANLTTLRSGTSIQNRILENRNGNPLTGILTIQVRDSVVQNVNTQNISIKRIIMSLVWPETPSVKDTITVEKWISPVQ